MSRADTVPFSFYLVTNRRLCGGGRGLVDRLRLIAEGLPRRTLAVQVREKDLDSTELLTLVRDVIRAVKPFGVPVLVNDRADVAIAAGAAGVHLPANGMSAGSLRSVYGGMIGVSTHSAAELAGLKPGEADFATFGPVFDTPEKRAYGPPQGPDALSASVAQAGIPVFAIGGISSETAPLLKGSRVAGLAAISSVLTAKDPIRAVVSLLRLASARGC
ncbi:MAG: thiamine phosphate synthase [Deltaproteobacteria bacterium]|nr:thiamine phosphate synthase [Deltaproteobacteria bacterium]